MPDTPVATTGVPAAIASTSTFGMPSRSSGARRHGMHSARRAAVLLEQLRLAHRAGQADASSRPSRAMRRADGVAVLVVLADDRGVERHAAARRTPHASTSTSKPFLATSRPTPRTRSVPLRRRRRSTAARAAARSRRSGRGRRGGPSPRARSRCRWRRLASVHVTTKRAASSLRRSQPRGFRSRRVDVARVAGEGERQAGDPRGEPGDRRRAVGEVGVQVADIGRGEQPVGERDAWSSSLT